MSDLEPVEKMTEDKVRSGLSDLFGKPVVVEDEEAEQIAKSIINQVEEIEKVTPGFNGEATLDFMIKNNLKDPVEAYRRMTGKSLINDDNLRGVLSTRMDSIQANLRQAARIEAEQEADQSEPTTETELVEGLHNISKNS